MSGMGIHSMGFDPLIDDRWEEEEEKTKRTTTIKEMVAREMEQEEISFCQALTKVAKQLGLSLGETGRLYIQGK